MVQQTIYELNDRIQYISNSNNVKTENVETKINLTEYEMNNTFSDTDSSC